MVRNQAKWMILGAYNSTCCQADGGGNEQAIAEVQ
jgi:hypothetical protein